MVVLSPTPLLRTKKAKAIGVPTIDLSKERSTLAHEIVRACDDYGFFKVINHRVPKEIIQKMENEGSDFFNKSAIEKQKAGPPSPFGYGCKNIGFNGDVGELEYLLLHTNPRDVDERSKSISNDPTMFSCTVNDYIQAVQSLACELLDLVADGLSISDRTLLSRLIRAVDSDSFFRLNHYPQMCPVRNNQVGCGPTKTGFGEHTDPQILTILRSNNVGGLQICTRDGLWVGVPPDSNGFCVFVGDVLQAMSNGRFLSARHRVLITNSAQSRMSMMYFAAPPLNACISPMHELVSSTKQSLYESFTWGEFKKALYTLRLGDCRLDLFKKNTTNRPNFSQI